MAYFAPVCPPQILQALKNYGRLGDYHLLLAHDIVAKEVDYHTIFDRPKHSPMTIILDNSVIELGGAVDLDVIVAAAKVVKPTTTVLPDVLLKSAETVSACQKALDVWTDRFQKEGLEPDFMIVPQGMRMWSWVRCAEAFADDKRINFWGIPRNLTEKSEMKTRRGFASILRAINRHRKIHLLGFSNNLVDDIQSAHEDGVMGIDSAVPIRAVNQGYGCNIEAFDNAPKRENWWEEAKFDMAMLNNLERVRDWFHG